MPGARWKGGDGCTTLTDAAATFEAKGVTRDKLLTCYCGGGISATIRPVSDAASSVTTVQCAKDKGMSIETR